MYICTRWRNASVHNQRSIHPTIEILNTMGYLNSIPRVLYTDQPGIGWSQFIAMLTLGFIHRTHQRRKLPSSTTEVIHFTIYLH